MQPFSFRCPHCEALLRVKESALVGREVPCPDCGELFRLAYDGRHVSRLDVEPVTSQVPPPQGPTASAPHSANTAVEPDVGDEAERERWWTEPHVVAWAVAIIFGTCMAIVVTTHEPPARVGDVVQEPLVVEQPEEVDPTEPQEEFGEDAAPSIWEAPAVDTRGQFARLGELIAQQRSDTNRFPAGTQGPGAPLERFSWLAELFAQSAGSDLSPVWNRPWNDPVNQRFVRRRMAVFLNPAVEELVGANGYPASHFVGMAGVGADAAALPVAHERAGIFGYDRQTTEADVKDGLANTIMVAGVQSPLGSWAAGGPATVRGFVNEPYINGPDGFGSGQKDGMWVLMADGSVKFHSVEADPAILRNEAAMADQYLREHPPELVAKNEAEAGHRDADAEPTADNATIDELIEIVEEIAQTEKTQQAKEAAENAPPPLTAEEIHTKLNQPVARYQTADGATFGVLFEELAEMVAVPLDYDAQPWHGDNGLWNRPVQLEFENVTVGEVFNHLLETVGLRATIGNGKIVIQKPDKT